MLLTEIKRTLQKEKVNAIRGGSSVTYFLKRHPDYAEYLKNFMIRFPSFKKVTEILAWLQNGVKIKKCRICGKRIDYTNSKNKGSFYCSRKCRFSEEGKKQANEKLKETLKGVPNVFSLESTKEKIRKTNLERYGAENAAKTEAVKAKMRQTCLERYGVEAYSSLESARKNISDKIKSKGFEQVMSRLKSNAYIPLFDEETYNCVTDKYPFKCQDCGKEYMGDIDDGRFPKCPYCHSKFRSKGEIEICDFISSLGIKTILNDRKAISDITKFHELDVYCPDEHLAFEFDGVYWHSETQKGKDYHKNKTEACASKGIRLIHIFEDEWNYKRQIVKSRIKAILGKTKYHIQARKCEVREISNALMTKFLEKYHIQGSINGKINLGLFYKERLVAVMNFSKSRFAADADWELLRYCTLFNFNVIGGAGKLLSHFRKHYKGSILTYADRRWSNGNLYEKLGFELVRVSNPAYYYVKNNCRYNRVKFQKHKLSKLLENFDENLSEWENMKNNGYERIYDCGNLVYILK